jgi:hypothetical protein
MLRALLKKLPPAQSNSRSGIVGLGGGAMLVRGKSPCAADTSATGASGFPKVRRLEEELI